MGLKFSSSWKRQQQQQAESLSTRFSDRRSEGERNKVFRSIRRKHVICYHALMQHIVHLLCSRCSTAASALRIHIFFLPANILHIKFLYSPGSECTTSSILLKSVSFPSADFSPTWAASSGIQTRNRNFFVFAFLMSLQFAVDVFAHFMSTRPVLDMSYESHGIWAGSFVGDERKMWRTKVL